MAVAVLQFSRDVVEILHVYWPASVVEEMTANASEVRLV